MEPASKWALIKLETKLFLKMIEELSLILSSVKEKDFALYKLIVHFKNWSPLFRTNIVRLKLLSTRPFDSGIPSI